MLRVLSIVYSLLQESRHATKRDVFYMDIAVFKDQSVVDHALNDICSLLHCPRHSLHITSVSKGLVAGDLRFKTGNCIVDCSTNMSMGLRVPMDIDQISNIVTSATFILVVEKETTFMRLLDDNFPLASNCILMTGKGYPDVSTRCFLRQIVDKLHLPCYGLMDCDPFGMDIIATYRFGSLKMAYDAENLSTPSIAWIGVSLSDINEFSIPESALVPLTKKDVRKGELMMSKESLIRLAPTWRSEINLMLKRGVKLEIEALSWNSLSYLASRYIIDKLKKNYVPY